MPIIHWYPSDQVLLKINRISYNWDAAPQSVANHYGSRNVWNAQEYQIHIFTCKSGSYFSCRMFHFHIAWTCLLTNKEVEIFQHFHILFSFDNITARMESLTAYYQRHSQGLCNPNRQYSVCNTFDFICRSSNYFKWVHLFYLLY